MTATPSPQAAVEHEAPSRLAVWWLAFRPKTLVAAFIPVFVGSAVAHSVGAFHLLAALAALLGALAIQVGTNLANDVYDAEKGADTDERLGPTRAVQAGLLSARAVRIGMWATFGVAALSGLYLIDRAGVAILVLGIVSIASGILYTAGPYPLAYLGLGDVFVMAFFGFAAVCGTTFVQAHVIPEAAWWASFAVGALSTAILVVNNLRDRSTDVKVDKKTLAVRFGRRFSIAQYALLLVGAFAVPGVLYLRGLSGVGVFLPMLTLPLAVRALRNVGARDGAALNPSLGETARLFAVFGVLFAVGLVL